MDAEAHGSEFGPTGAAYITMPPAGTRKSFVTCPLIRTPTSDDIMFLMQMTFAVAMEPKGIGKTAPGGSLV